MNEERRTGMYLLFASVVSVFSALLILITIAMSWESWMVPLIFIGCFVVWMVHITRIGSEVLYENICAGLLMGEFFFFGVHRISLYDMAIVACIILIVLSVLDRKRLLYMTAALYVFGE